MPNLKPSTILKRARKLIARGWCKFHLAVDVHGIEVHEKDRNAVRWCALGAVCRAAPKPEDETAPWEYLNLVAGGSIVAFNNSQRNKRPVLRAFDRAIKLAISEGK